MSETVKPENLNGTMSFEHVIRVNADGTVDGVEESFHFEILHVLADASTGLWEFQSTLPDGWELMTGYTGQHGYNGPVMHSSEFIGGRMALDILSEPGMYVALAVEADCFGQEDGCDEEDGCYCEPDGWVVARKLD